MTNPAIEILAPAPDIVGFEDLVDEILERLGRSSPATACVVGRPGSGRTTALRALATRLGAEHGDGPVHGSRVARLRAESVVGGSRAEPLRELVQRGEAGDVVAIDDLEVVMLLASPAYDLDVRGAVRALIGRSDVRTVVTLDADYAQQLETQEAELFGELEIVRVPELESDDLDEIGVGHAWELSTEQGVGVPAGLVEAAAGPSIRGDRKVHPGLMMQRLDHAATRARLRGAETATVEDLELTAGAGAELMPAPELSKLLRERIAGQDEAVERVCKRLALTRAGLDLRPHRPNGVFLFAGPSGVARRRSRRRSRTPSMAGRTS